MYKKEYRYGKCDNIKYEYSKFDGELHKEYIKRVDDRNYKLVKDYTK